MAFNRFGFTKHWTNPIDFPTIESEESKVRADMQCLHDEAKDGINQLIGELEAGAAAGSIGAKDKSGGNSTVQAEFNKLATDQHTHSNKSLLDTYDQTNANLKSAVSKAHSHSNSSILNSCTAAFTTTLKSAYDRLVTLFAGVTSVTTTLGGDHTTIPTSKAVSDAIAQSGALPAGGSTGYALFKASSENYDMEWGPVTPEAIGARPNTWMPTAADVGAMHSNFGYLTATDLFAWADEQTVGGTFAVDPSVTTKNIPASGKYFTGILEIAGNGRKMTLTSTTIGYDDDGNTYTSVKTAGVWRSWYRLATTDYALPRDGSAAMTGALNMALAPNGYANILKNHNATLDYGTDFGDYDSSNAHANINISAKNNKVTWYGTDRVGHDILHTGNYDNYADAWTKLASASVNVTLVTRDSYGSIYASAFPNLTSTLSDYQEIYVVANGTLSLIIDQHFMSYYKDRGCWARLNILGFELDYFNKPSNSYALGTYTKTVNAKKVIDCPVDTMLTVTNKTNQTGSTAINPDDYKPGGIILQDPHDPAKYGGYYFAPGATGHVNVRLCASDSSKNTYPAPGSGFVGTVDIYGRKRLKL